MKMREQEVDLLNLELLLKHVNVDDCVSEIKQNLIDCLRKDLDSDSRCSHVADSLHVMSALIGRLSESGRNSKKDVYFEITKGIVCPLLTTANADVFRRSWASLINITSQLSSDTDCFQKLVNTCYQMIKDNTANSKLSHHSGHQDESVVVMLHVQLLSQLLQKAPLDVPWLQRFQEDLLAEVSSAMLLADDKVVGCMMSLLLPALIGDQLTENHVTLLWETILDSFQKYGFFSIMDSPSAMSERPILLMCEIADVFFPATGISNAVLSLLQTDDFWNVLQSGFFHHSSLTRKRTVYLLKRLLDVIETQSLEILPKTSSQPLFWWLPSKKQELSDLWMNYILLVETLEEKQVHVIQPLMPRFQPLVEASSCIVVHQTGGELTLLHTSWLLCLSQRAASHDNSHVQRWIVQQILELDLNKCPIFSQGYYHFFCGPLVKMLSVSSLYHRPQDVLLGQCPPIAQSVVTFFRNVALAVDEEIRAGFFHDLLKGILSQTWGGGPLVFVTRGLAHISGVPLIKDYMIPTLRDLTLSPLSTLQACFRSAIQYYVTLLVTNCSDLDSVSVASFCSIIACLKSGETWKRGTHFYRQLVTFLSEAGTTSPLWCEDQIKDHLITSIQNYVIGKKDAEDDSVEFVYQQCLQIIRLLVLAYDCHSTKSVSNQPSPYHFETLLVIPLDILCSVNSHAYISMTKVHRSLVLFTVLMQETDTLKETEDNSLKDEVKKLVNMTANDILLFIQRQVVEVMEVAALSYMDIYLDVLQTLSKFFCTEMCMASHITSLVDTCVHTAELRLKDPHTNMLAVYSSVRVLAVLCELLLCRPDLWQLSWTRTVLDFSRHWHIIQQLPKPDELKQESCQQGMSYDLQIWGRTASHFLASQWTCLHLYLSQRNQQGCEQTELPIIMEDCLVSLDLTSGDDVLPVLHCMTYLFKHETESSKCHVISVSWRKVQESLKDSSFWPAFDVFLDMAFHPDVLSEPLETRLGQDTCQLLTDLFELGEEKSGIVYKIIQRLCSWARTDKKSIRQAKVYISNLITGLLFGPVHSRGKRFVNEVIHFLLCQEQLPGNQLLNSSHKADAAARVQVLSFLVALNPDDPDQKEFIHNFIYSLMSKYEEIAKLTTYRNYINSLPHRQKHRIFTALLLLQPAINEDLVPDVFNFLQKMLVSESQPSVRCMVEWLIILFIKRGSHLMDTIWNALQNGSDQKPAYLCSLLTIIAHVSKLISDRNNQVLYMDKGVREVLPWCMAHQFNVRTFGQATLFSLWEQCKENKLESVLSKHEIIDSFMLFSRNNRVACKSTFKLMDNFFFQFHPLRDYSVETIVHTLPMLTCMTDEEWIPLGLFTEIEPRWASNTFLVPLYNVSDELKHSTPGTWKVKNSARDVDQEAGASVTSGDVQKKMIPWRMMIPETELSAEMLSEYKKKKQKTDGLIVVTSLIDKIPNLGGLCRTAEIFGVSEFVIGNLSYIDDQGFKSLSVSAHQWIPIQEVYRSRLKDYIMEMKTSGYSVIGAEQTAQSQCLTEFSFPQKSLLILGNEKEGIPVDIIKLLDVCVEIPQQGIIRSLNVHVSGALLIWEYTRQQLQKHPSL